MLVAVRGMHEAALLFSGITPEDILPIAYITSILRGSPLSRPRFLVPTTMVPRVASSGAIGVEVRVILLLQRQLQKKDRQVLVCQGPCLAFRRSPTLILHVSGDLGQQPERHLIAAVRSGRQSPYSVVQVSQQFRDTLRLFGNKARFWISVQMDRSVS